MIDRLYSRSSILLFLMIILLSPCSFGQAGQRFLFAVYVNGKGGFIDQTGHLVIKPQFDEVRDFSEGLAAVKVGTDWGYIDEKGSMVVPPRFVYAQPFSGGIACVLTTGYGFIDRQGSFVVPPKFDQGYSPSEGLARVGIGGRGGSPFPGLFKEPRLPEEWLFLDHQGTTVLRPKFDYVDDFHGGFALVAKRSQDRFLVNYINREGRLAFVNWFAGGRWFSEGVAIVSNDLNGWTGEYSGRLIYDNLNTNPLDFSGRNKPIDFLLIDGSGNKTAVGEFEDITDFSEGLAAVQLDGKWGYINKQGQFVIQPKFDRAGDFSEGLACVQEGENGRLINRSGGRVLSVNCDSANNFHHGLAKVRILDKTGYIDRSGHVVWAPTK